MAPLVAPRERSKVREKRHVEVAIYTAKTAPIKERNGEAKIEGREK